MTERGKYIVLEGGDGVGKSTTMHLVAESIRTELEKKVYTVEEPGSIRDDEGNILVPIADELRTIIKDKALGRSAFTNVLLFNAARRENWLQVMSPALDDGIWILGTRNWWSTIAYQGGGEGINAKEIQTEIEKATAPEYTWPDLGVILDLDETIRASRVNTRDNKGSGDTFESRPSEFHLAVREAYRAFAQKNNIPIISTTVPAEEVSDQVLALISSQYPAPPTT